MTDVSECSVNAGDSTLDVGRRLRAIRTAHRLSQRELARRAGVTNGLISQIEQNNSSPSISSLKRILDAIPLTLAAFFEGDMATPNKIFYTAAELLNINPNLFRQEGESGAGKISLRQVGDVRGRSIQMLHERYGPGADTGIRPYKHEAEEVGIIISAEIELTVGIDIAVLGPGDAYLFDSRTPHRFRNKGDVDCVIVSACTPPTF